MLIAPDGTYHRPSNSGGVVHEADHRCGFTRVAHAKIVTAMGAQGLIEIAQALLAEKSHHLLQSHQQSHDILRSHLQSHLQAMAMGAALLAVLFALLQIDSMIR